MRGASLGPARVTASDCAHTARLLLPCFEGHRHLRPMMIWSVSVKVKVSVSVNVRGGGQLPVEHCTASVCSPLCPHISSRHPACSTAAYCVRHLNATHATHHSASLSPAQTSSFLSLSSSFSPPSPPLHPPLLSAFSPLLFAFSSFAFSSVFSPSLPALRPQMGLLERCITTMFGMEKTCSGDRIGIITEVNL